MIKAALLRNSRKTECGAKQLLTRLEVRTAPFALLTSLAALACVAVSGAPRSETSTYVDGNVSTLKPNTGGTLVFTDNNSMTFRSGSADVTVPYASILHADLGPVQTHNHGPLGISAIVGLLHKTQTRLLTVEFKSGLGEDQKMTLELARPDASHALATIQEHTAKSITEAKTSAPKTAGGKEAWWGDEYWKTVRNQDSWNAKEASNSSANTTNTK